MNKEIQAAILRAAGRFISKRLDSLEPRLKALETRSLVPGPAGDKGVAGERGEPGTAGRDGLDGKSVTLDEVLPVILPEVRKAIAEIARPESGRDGRDGERGIDGKSITVDDMLPVLRSMQAEWALDFERRAVETMQRSIDRMPLPKDGKDGSNGTDGLGWDDLVVEFDDRRTVTVKLIRGDVEKVAGELKMPVVIDAGFWKEGLALEKGDGVTFGGSYWIAQKDTDTKPDVGNPDWRLAVKKGRDGKDAERVPARPVLQVP